MKKKFVLGIVITMIACLLLVACESATTTPAESPAETATEAEKIDAEKIDAEKIDIDFYGKIVEYTAGPSACEKLQELLVDKYNINSLQVDWGNLEQVIRTGIASGEPCDIYCYWPMYLKTFIDDGMCLDLTPYLDADDGAWRKMIQPGMLSLGEYDGKIYGIPTDANAPCLIANKDLFDQAGVAIPTGTYWSWDDFTTTCADLKAAGVFAWSMPTDNQKSNWMWRLGIVSSVGGVEVLDNYNKGLISCLDPLFVDVMTKVKDVYDKGYMYPGEGAVTLTTDESRAAFAQGKVAISAEVAAGVGTIIADLPFEAVIIPWPAMGTSGMITGGTDGYFIPANVKDPDAAVEVLKAYTSLPVQQLFADSGLIVASTETTTDDPIVDALIEQFTGNNMISDTFMNISPELMSYCADQTLAELVLGGGIDSLLQAMEELRLEALSE